MITPEAGDPTPLVGSATDVSPLGRSTPKPAHELTAAEDNGAPHEWEKIAAMPAFQELLRVKLRFIIPCTIFFFVYYFILPWSVGYHPEFMKKEIFGRVNLAYAFALSQFFMAWILAAIYVRAAAGWDRRANDILANRPGR